MNDVDASFLDAADIERVGVNELHDDYAKDVVIGNAIGHKDFGKAAE